MAEGRARRGLSRRSLLIGGGAGAGLLVAWALWPRSYRPNLHQAAGETIVNAFLKIGEDGRVVVAIPQAEIGQGVWTSLPQILADELGADGRTIAVEPAPISPLYANDFLADTAAQTSLPGFLQGVGGWTAREYAMRQAVMLTAGSTSIRAFEPRMREAGAAARLLLMKAAARRWNADWTTLDTAGSFVTGPLGKLRFGELAEQAVREELEDDLPARGGLDNRLYGQPLARLDLPSKVDGTTQFAGDVRLPDLVYAASRSAPSADSRLIGFDKQATLDVPGVIGIFDSPGWMAVVASNWWAANRGLGAAKPEWRIPGDIPTDESISSALIAALERDEGSRIFSRGDVAQVYREGPVLRAHYVAMPAANAPLETLTATARFAADRLEIWAPTQAPQIARQAAAEAAGLGESQVSLYPAPIGGGYGRKIEVRAIEQAAMLAMRTRRPVQLVWSRVEESVQDTFRAPARASMTARLGPNGAILAWQTRIAAPDILPQLRRRLGNSARLLAEPASPMAGAVPPYGIPAILVDHLPAEIALPFGLWRSGAHGYTAFFTECFVDELSRQANIEPLSFRMQMLGSNPRLARCLTTAAALGGWDGGQPGSTMGIACHSAFGSHIAVLVEIEMAASAPRVLRAVASVDCGRVVNPNILKQQIEGGLVFGIAAATGRAIAFDGRRPSALGFRDFGFPALAASPEISVEIIDSEEEPGGATELGVPVAAPAIANAVFALTGRRPRTLPLFPERGA
jgi:isoquinoline 1-oxidoreductase beta subunit